MPSPSAAASFPAGDPELPDDVVVYGPDIADEDELRLIGHVSGKRLLVLGAGGGQAAVALAGQGAHVIVVDNDHRALDEARDRADRLERRLELHHGDLADLAFIRADTVDGVVSVYELGRQSDLDRVLRQAHRVLRTGGALTCSLPHPAFLLLEPRADDPFRVVHTYLDRSPRGEDAAVVYPRSLAEVFGAFHRANFRVDAVLEPGPTPQGGRRRYWSEAMRRVPATLVLRARKEGI
ncbi:MAG: class I SAM-dependent methyltransferase [Acidimicrobiales bacterium]|jgi:SAM-dependent methyltransferase|nr:class I SAM-dependent methyltransferase [Acidimicrobiales bacterium]